MTCYGFVVGGDFDRIGEREAQIMLAAGSNEEHSLVEIGCGSGRLAKQLGRQFPALRYDGRSSPSGPCKKTGEYRSLFDSKGEIGNAGKYQELRTG
jgi:hypothetical protein